MRYCVIAMLLAFPCAVIGLLQAAAVEGGCNPNAKRTRVEDDTIGYGPRSGEGDQRCEGLFRSPVSSAPEVSITGCVMWRDTNFKADDHKTVTLCWPHSGLGCPVDLEATSARGNIFYRMDAQEPAHPTPERRVIGCDDFRWDTSVLSIVKKSFWSKDKVVLDELDISLLASATIGDHEPIPADAPFELRGCRLLLPLVLHQTASNDAGASAPPATRPQAEPSMVTVSLTVNATPSIQNLVVEYEPIGVNSPVQRCKIGEDRKPRQKWSASIKIPADGRYWHLRLTFERPSVGAVPQRPVEYYLLAPSEAYVAWAKSLVGRD